MTHNEAKQYIMDMYPGRMYIGKQEVCQLLSTSIPTLNSRLSEDSILAKIARKEPRRVLFPLPDLARLLANEE